MEILGIGPMELFFIVVLAIIILGPRDMAKAGRTVGKFLRDVVQSDYYRAFMSSSREFRNLPTRLIREANLEDEMKEVDKSIREAASDPTPNTIHPPREVGRPIESPSAEAAGESLPTDGPEA
jgi:Sec-independent protein translocase protein TatA